MAKTIIITESAKDKLVELISEAYDSKVEIVKRFLDKNFMRAHMDSQNDNGEYTTQGVVVQKDVNGQPTKKTLSDVQLFYLLQNRFKNIIGADDSENNNSKTTYTKRDNFLKQVIKDWYNNKITKNNILSRY